MDPSQPSQEKKHKKHKHREREAEQEAVVKPVEQPKPAAPVAPKASQPEPVAEPTPSQPKKSKKRDDAPAAASTPAVPKTPEDTKDGKPKPNQSAYLHFVASVRPKITAELSKKYPDGHLRQKEVVTVAAEWWKKLPEADRKAFEEEAVKDKARYDSDVQEFLKAHPGMTEHDLKKQPPKKRQAKAVKDDEEHPVVKKHEPVHGVNVTEWTVDKVAAWIKKDTVAAPFAAAFVTARIDGRALLTLTRQDLAALGVSAVGDALHILHLVGELKELHSSERREKLFSRIRDAVNEFIE